MVKKGHRKKKLDMSKIKIDPLIKKVTKEMGVKPIEAYKALLTLKKGKIKREEIDIVFPRKILEAEGTSPEKAAEVLYIGMKRPWYEKKQKKPRFAGGLKAKADYGKLIGMIMFSLYARGVEPKKIAKKLGISSRMVRDYLQTIRGPKSPDEIGISTKMMYKKMSPETKKVKDDKISKKKERWWAKVDKKQKQDIMNALDKGRKRFWSGEDPVRLELVKQHMSEGQKKRWSLISPKALEDFCKAISKGWQRKLGEMSPTELQEFKDNQSNIAQQFWNNLDTKSREIQSNKIAKGVKGHARYWYDHLTPSKQTELRKIMANAMISINQGVQKEVVSKMMTKDLQVFWSDIDIEHRKKFPPRPDFPKRPSRRDKRKKQKT